MGILSKLNISQQQRMLVKFNVLRVIKINYQLIGMKKIPTRHIESVGISLCGAVLFNSEAISA